VFVTHVTLLNQEESFGRVACQAQQQALQKSKRRKKGLRDLMAAPCCRTSQIATLFHVN
jgi:hypothetical protein